MAWDQQFADPIAPPKGNPLQTLRDAGHYVAALPAREQNKPHWREATKLLLLVGNHGGDPMIARIAMMQALNHGKPKPISGPRVRRSKAVRIIRS